MGKSTLDSNVAVKRCCDVAVQKAKVEAVEGHALRRSDSTTQVHRGPRTVILDHFDTKRNSIISQIEAQRVRIHSTFDPRRRGERSSGQTESEEEKRMTCSPSLAGLITNYLGTEVDDL